MATLDMHELAAQYGWSMALLNSSPELKDLFSKAVKDHYPPEKFTAELRNTKWYRKHSESWRQAQVLKTTDPQTYQTQVNSAAANVRAQAQQMGARISTKTMYAIAGHVVQLGWNDAQVQTSLQHFVKANSNGLYGGQAEQNLAELRQYAHSMGIRIPDKSLQTWAVKSIGKGTEIYKEQMLQWAEQAFPAYAKQLRGGITLEDIAAPYKQSMASMLEINPDAIDTFNPVIRSALTATSQDGKPAHKTLWEFENDLRKDPRWAKTQNAQDAGMSVVNDVLKNFGLIS